MDFSHIAKICGKSYTGKGYTGARGGCSCGPLLFEPEKERKKTQSGWLPPLCVSFGPGILLPVSVHLRLLIRLVHRSFFMRIASSSFGLITQAPVFKALLHSFFGSSALPKNFQLFIFRQGKKICLFICIQIERLQKWKKPQGAVSIGIVKLVETIHSQSLLSGGDIQFPLF